MLPNLMGPAPGAPVAMPGAVPPPIGGPGGPQMGPTPFGAGMLGGMPGGGAPDPAAAQYVAKTQSDGTVLLHIKLPNGELGPAVKIISVGGRGARQGM